MITVDYVRLMARFNQWQNTAVIASAEQLDAEELQRDRGAFFGSIQRTLNHILWGDRVWMSRFDGWTLPEGVTDAGTEGWPTLAAWKADRMRADGHIRLWAKRLRPIQLRGELSWYSGTLGREVAMPVATCVMHMFNHQTHHRGQVHAMLTAAGAKTTDTDLVFMPEDT